MLEQSKRTPFLPIFLIWYTSEIIFNTTLTEIAGISIEQMNDAFNYLVLGLLLMQIIFFQKYEKKELFVIGLITVPIVISAALSAYFSVLSAWMFIIAAKDTDFDEIILVVYKVLKVMIPLIIVLYLMGVIDDYTMVRNGMLRHSLGFSHPNQLGLRIFQFLACRFYIKEDAQKTGSYLWALLLVLFAYFIPNSQTSCICMTVLVVFFVLWGMINKYCIRLLNFFENCLIVLAILCNVLSVVWSIAGVSGNKMLEQINTWMSLRFSGCHRTFLIYGASLLGQRIYLNEGEGVYIGLTSVLYLDNAYMALILRYGIIVYLIFSIGYLLAMLYCKRNHQTGLTIILAIYALYGVMENGLFVTSHNIFLISITNVLYQRVCWTGLKHENRRYVIRLRKAKE